MGVFLAVAGAVVTSEPRVRARPARMVKGKAVGRQQKDKARRETQSIRSSSAWVPRMQSQTLDWLFLSARQSPTPTSAPVLPGEAAPLCASASPMARIRICQVPRQSAVELSHGFWISTTPARASELLSTWSVGNLDICGFRSHVLPEHKCSTSIHVILSMVVLETRRSNGACWETLGLGPRGNDFGDLMAFTVSRAPSRTNLTIQRTNPGSFTERTPRQAYLDAAWVCAKAEGRDACNRRPGPSSRLTITCWLRCES